MKQLLILLTTLSVFILQSCSDDYISTGKIWVYPQSEISDIADGAYIVNNKAEYKQLMGNSMPGDWNIDFDNTVLVIAKGTENQSIADIKATASTDGSTYIVNIDLKLSNFLPIESWEVAIVMPRVKNPTVQLNVKTKE